MGILHDIILKPQAVRSELLDEIRRTVDELNTAHIWFEAESDPDLIEACVYRMESLEAKYRYLMRLARAEGLRRDACTGEATVQRETAPGLCADNG